MDDFSRPRPQIQSKSIENIDVPVQAADPDNDLSTSSGEISDSMRQRLIKEMQSQGADANFSAGNPILIISGVIALLVILGGKGFFY